MKQMVARRRVSVRAGLAEENRAELLRAHHDAGAPLLVGTDDRAEIIHDGLSLNVAIAG